MLFKKILIIGTILLFLGTCITPSIAINNSKKSTLPISTGNTLYVGGTGPGNYTKIQDAIDNASWYDSVFVFNGTYYENLYIDKILDLTGEDKSTTIIDGGGKYKTIEILFHRVRLSGFTITNGEYGIYTNTYIEIFDNIIKMNQYCGIGMFSSYNTIVKNNIITMNDIGISVYYPGENTIEGNNIFNNYRYGIWLDDTIDDKVKDNNISNNGIGLIITQARSTIVGNSFFNDGLIIFESYGNTVTNNNVNGKPLVYLEEESDIVIEPNAGQIILYKCNNITVQNQEIFNTTYGIYLYYSDNCLISNNIITSSENGIRLWGSYKNTITYNEILKNQEGIHLIGSSKNYISKNNLILNELDAYFSASYKNCWKQNFWNSSRILPKFITGRMRIFLFIIIPWFNIDWHPAREPYDI